MMTVKIIATIIIVVFAFFVLLELVKMKEYQGEDDNGKNVLKQMTVKMRVFSLAMVSFLVFLSLSFIW